MIFRIAALGIGALAMYYLDPTSGKRRRALLRDQVVHARHRVGDYAEGKARYLRDRAQGLVARSRRKLDIDLTQDLGR